MSDFGGALMAAERDNSEVLLAFTPTVPDVLELLVHSRTTRPEMGLVVAIPGPANGSLGEALMAGAHEIVILPAERTVVAAAVQKAVARVSTRPAQTAAAIDTRSPLVVVLGPKGGVGKTTVATNLATTLAAERPADAADRPRPAVRRRRARARRAARPHHPRPGGGPGTAGR